MAELYRFLFEEFGLKRVEVDINNNTLDFVVIPKDEIHTDETSGLHFPRLFTRI
jgi:hypothetical protein